MARTDPLAHELVERVEFSSPSVTVDRLCTLTRFFWVGELLFPLLSQSSVLLHEILDLSQTWTLVRYRDARN